MNGSVVFLVFRFCSCQGSCSPSLLSLIVRILREERIAREAEERHLRELEACAMAEEQRRRDEARRLQEEKEAEERAKAEEEENLLLQKQVGISEDVQ